MKAAAEKPNVIQQQFASSANREVFVDNDLGHNQPPPLLQMHAYNNPEENNSNSSNQSNFSNDILKSHGTLAVVEMPPFQLTKTPLQRAEEERTLNDNSEAVQLKMDSAPNSVQSAPNLTHVSPPFKFNQVRLNDSPIQRHGDHEDHDSGEEHTEDQQNTGAEQTQEGGQSRILSLIELALFNLRSVWGPRSLVPPIFANRQGYGGFEALYNRPGKQLQVKVRGKTQFINGLTDSGSVITSNQEDLDQLANILNIIGDPVLNGNITSCYTWTDDGKDTAKEQFRQRLAESVGIWENTALEFYIDKPGWEDITARLNVSLEVEEEGTLGDTASRQVAGQHQQIQIYKTPDANETSLVRSSLDRAIEKFEQNNAMSIGNVDQLDVRAFVDGDTDSDNYADDNPYNGSMTLSSNDLENSQANIDHSMLSRRVFFDINSHTLSPGQAENLRSFIGRFTGDGDANRQNNAIRLIGHASKSGTDEYNRALVQRRINSVKAVLAGSGITNFDERISGDNQNQTGHNANPDHNPAYYQSVEVKIGSGERQNTVAHEFGHVFGLADEYEEGGRQAGNASGHDKLSRDMGTGRAMVENNDSIISMGNELRTQHYAPFVWALRELTSKQWLVRNQA